jgi:superfamily I DNA/RNA helicase
MSGQEDQIVILISNRRLQLGPITRELANLGIPFDPPGGQAIRDETSGRAVYSLLRLVRDQTTGVRDYAVYRGLMGQLHGVGVGTSKNVGDLCVANNQNYRELFQLAVDPHWLFGRAAAAVSRVRGLRQAVAGWTLQDTVADRTAEIAQLVSGAIFTGSHQADAYSDEWRALADTLPEEMTLEELLMFLSADDEADQRRVLDAVNERIGPAQEEPGEPAQNRIRILTMHGAKGLSGRVVFIPSVEQGIMPNFKAIRAAGLLIEQAILCIDDTCKGGLHRKARSTARWRRGFSNSTETAGKIAQVRVGSGHADQALGRRRGSARDHYESPPDRSKGVAQAQAPEPQPRVRVLSNIRHPEQRAFRHASKDARGADWEPSGAGHGAVWLAGVGLA